jgi:hypothetical protein
MFWSAHLSILEHVSTHATENWSKNSPQT